MDINQLDPSANVTALRIETGPVRFVDHWLIEGLFRGPAPSRPLDDVWDRRWDGGSVGPRFGSCEEFGPSEFGTREWVAGPFHSGRHGDPVRVPVRVPEASLLLNAFERIDVDDPEVCRRRIARFADRFGLLGLGLLGWDPASPLQEGTAVHGLLEPVVLWRLEARAIRLMRHLRMVANARTLEGAAALRAQFEEVRAREDEGFPGARAMVRLSAAYEAGRSDHSADPRRAALQAYARLVNGALAGHSRVTLSLSPFSLRAEVTDAYGLLYHALARELPARSTGQICARPGCGELIPPGSHYDARYCGTARCQKARYRERKRQGLVGN